MTDLQNFMNNCLMFNRYFILQANKRAILITWNWLWNFTIVPHVSCLWSLLYNFPILLFSHLITLPFYNFIVSLCYYSMILLFCHFFVLLTIFKICRELWYFNIFIWKTFSRGTIEVPVTCCKLKSNFIHVNKNCSVRRTSQRARKWSFRAHFS